MRNTILLKLFLVFGLSACAQPRIVDSDLTELKKSNINQILGEKCEEAKHQLEKTVEEGQLSDLKHLKKNIELHCVWRRN